MNVMQPMTNYSNLPVSNDLTSRAPEIQPDLDNGLIAKLWSRVCLNDMDALEIIHSLLYPILLKYVYFIIKDSAIADDMIAEAFIRFWNKRSGVIGETLKIDLAKSLRQAAALYLENQAIDRNRDASPQPMPIGRPIILLSSYNNLSFKEREKAFLRDYLKLDRKAIAEIIGS